MTEPTAIVWTVPFFHIFVAFGRALDQVLVPVSGGRALETSLVSILITSDGRVLVGAVSIDQLQAAAAK